MISTKQQIAKTETIALFQNWPSWYIKLMCTGTYRVRHKKQPLWKLEFLENNQACFAMFFTS